ncbi:MAG: DUF4405 domain-containing protein [Caldilineaceae bacterium]
MAVATKVSKLHSRFRLSETLKNFGVDIALFLMFIIDMNTRFTGIPIHEWLGIVLGGALVYHLLLHWQWIVALTRKIVSRLPTIQRIRYFVDLLLFIDMVIVVASGILISEAALPQIGIEIGRNFYWRGLHHSSTELISWLVGLHLALSWGWITSAFSRYLWQPLTGTKRSKTKNIRPAGEFV